MHDRARPKRIAGRLRRPLRRVAPVRSSSDRPRTAEAADPHDLPAVQAVAEPGARAEKTEHRNLSARDPELENQLLNKGTVATLPVEFKVFQRASLRGMPQSLSPDWSRLNER